MSKSKIVWKPGNNAFNYILAFVMGMMVGFKVIPPTVVAVAYGLVAGLCIIRCLQGRVDAFFGVLPYVMYTEIIVRAYARFMPYLLLQYLFIICFVILMIKGGKMKKFHFMGIIFLILFTFLEVANNIYPNKALISRSIIGNSFALLVPAIWASYNSLKPALINKLLNNIKIAGVYLTGAVFVAHITGKIVYAVQSSSDASNGMAPVQLSGYLGFVSILFFISIMNPEERGKRTMNMIVFAVVSGVMVMTFSRGGLYFLGAIAATYIYYNRAQMGNYVKFLFLIPVAIGIYFLVDKQTDGKIVERYEQKGTSNRDVLVNIGFKIFAENPFVGVGTGNFNTVIVKEKLYDQESGVHNEYVRAAAEHGIIGVVFYWGFYVSLFLIILSRRQPQKQFSMYFFVLFCLIIVHNGLKISIQPILLMLAIALPTLVENRKKNVYYKQYAQKRFA